MQPSLGNLSQRLDKGLNLVALRVADFENRVRVLVERVNNLHGLLGNCRPLPIDQVGNDIGVGAGSQSGGVDCGPRWNKKGGHHTFSIPNNAGQRYVTCRSLAEK